MFELQGDILFLGCGGTLLSLLEAVIHEDSEGSLVDEYVIYQPQVVVFMRFIVSVMILIFMASALSGCIVGEFVQSP